MNRGYCCVRKEKNPIFTGDYIEILLVVLVESKRLLNQHALVDCWGGVGGRSNLLVSPLARIWQEWSMRLRWTPLAQSEPLGSLAGRLVLSPGSGAEPLSLFLTGSQVMLKVLICEPNLSRRDLDCPSHTSVFSSMEFQSTVLNISFFVVLLRVRIIPSSRFKKQLAFDETSSWKPVCEAWGSTL